jgi:hypothetical protein
MLAFLRLTPNRLVSLLCSGFTGWFVFRGHQIHRLHVVAGNHTSFTLGSKSACVWLGNIALLQNKQVIRFYRKQTRQPVGCLSNNSQQWIYK